MCTLQRENHGTIRRQKTSAVAAVEIALKLEKDPLFTQNTHYLESCREKWLSHYRSVRRYPENYKIPLEDGPWPILGEPSSPVHVDLRRYPYSRSGTPSPSPIEKALSTLAELGYKNLTATDLARLTQEDRFQEELIVMADVRAYFQVAYKVISEVLLLHWDGFSFYFLFCLSLFRCFPARRRLYPAHDRARSKQGPCEFHEDELAAAAGLGLVRGVEATQGPTRRRPEHKVAA